MPVQRKVAILIFDDVEVLDFCGPFEVFSVTGKRDGSDPFDVFTIAAKPGPVLARNGLSVNPRYTLGDCPQPDILVVPGGFGTRKEMHNSILIDWIKTTSVKAELIVSVCTGSLLLAKAGLLDGLASTTHHGALELLKETAPRAIVRADQRVVDNGRIICSAGISAGIDASFCVVARLLGNEQALEAARHMEYDWRPKAG